MDNNQNAEKRWQQIKNSYSWQTDPGFPNDLYRKLPHGRIFLDAQRLFFEFVECYRNPDFRPMFEQIRAVVDLERELTRKISPEEMFSYFLSPYMTVEDYAGKYGVEPYYIKDALLTSKHPFIVRCGEYMAAEVDIADWLIAEREKHYKDMLV